jgi:predicted phage terminase large subunit-like protein
MIQKFKPRQSKEIRLDMAMVPIEAGKVLLPEQATWLPDLINELMAFPASVINDQVDALSQALGFFGRMYKDSYHNPDFRNRGRVIYPRNP